MRFKDYYEVLGVKPDASADEIKSAYRKLARKFHPDVSKEKNAEERFKDINEAFEALKEPDRRAAYDQARTGGFRAGDEFRPSGGHGGFDFGDAGNGQFSDFFESLFGRARAAHGGGRRSARHEGAGEVRAELEVDLATAYAGGKQRFSLQGPRPWHVCTSLRGPSFLPRFAESVVGTTRRAGGARTFLPRSPPPSGIHLTLDSF